MRHRLGKSDPINAEIAARSVLAGVAAGTPKHTNGDVEMVRMLKMAKNSAVFAANILVAAGTSREHAETVADVLV